MIYVATHVEDEVTEHVVAGVIVRLTKRHVIEVPVEINFDPVFGQFSVKLRRGAIDTSCLITSDVVGMASDKSPESDTLIDLQGLMPTFKGYAH